jgi:co-chaperonin GroES (HSP10)
MNNSEPKFSTNPKDWTPLNNHLLVEIYERNEIAGIILPPDTQNSKFIGRVLAVAEETDPKKPIRVKVGQVVYFGWGGSKLDKLTDSDKHMLVPYDKILMVIDQK